MAAGQSGDRGLVDTVAPAGPPPSGLPTNPRDGSPHVVAPRPSTTGSIGLLRGSLRCSEFRPLGTRRFKNVREAVEVYSAVNSSDAEGRSGRLLTDPVCRMSVDPVLSTERRTHRAVEHHFCSPACAEAFDADPDLYHRRRSSRGGMRISDDARERVAAFLRRAYRRGRLDVDELDERLAHVFVARTRGELEAAVTDLPGHRRLRRGRRRFLPWRRRRRRGS